MKIVFNLLLTLLLLATGCANHSQALKEVKPQAPELLINDELFEPTANIIPPVNSIFQLTEKQQKLFFSDFNQRVRQGVKPHQAIADFMTNKLDGFTFYGETYDAPTALAQRKGNCMSLAMITTALAKLVGLKFNYRYVSSEPIYDKLNGFMLVSSHVQTKLYDPTHFDATKFYSFSKPAVIIDYFPTTNSYTGTTLHEPEFIAMYYVNLAAEQLIAGNIDAAFQLTLSALEQDATNSGAINILAVLHKKRGDLVTAESLYKLGLHHEKKNIRLLSNYIILLKQLNRVQDVNIQQAKLDKLDDPNPYAWLEQAYVAQSGNQQRQAIRYYKKALDIAPYLQPAYQGLYQIYLQENRNKDAKNILKQALNWSHEPSEKKRYKYKLYQLSKQY